MSDENSNVTFVGGKAIEQHESLDSNVEPDVKEEAKEAVRKAIAEAAQESKDSAEKASKQDPFKAPGAKGDSPVNKKPFKADETPTRGPDGKFLPRDGTKEGSSGEDEPDDATSLKNLLKGREKAAQSKKETHVAFEKERKAIEEQTKQIQQLHEQLRQERASIEREKQKYERLRKDPAAAIRDVGWDPEQFIVDLARDGTPEGQAARQQRELHQQLQELKAWKEEQAQQHVRQQEEAKWQQQVSYRQHIEKSFLDDSLHEENRPHTNAFYKGRENALLAYADQIAAQYRDLSGGKEASLKEVADFIEDELAERANSWYEKKSGTKKDSVSPDAKPGKGSKGKSLTPEAASERRSLGRKALKDLDEDERLEAARASVAAALSED